MTVQLPSYDFNDIWERREQGQTWDDIADVYQRGKSTVYEWYQREKKRRAEGRQETLLVSSGHSGKPTNKKRTTTNIRREKYGSVQPTGLQVDIETIDDLVAWIQKYTPYMQGEWDNANTRQNAETLFFDVYRDGMNTLLCKPRDSGKSKVSVAVYACILANYYHTQMSIVAGSKAKTRIFNGLLRIVKSPQFRRDYGDIVDSQNKLTGEIWLHDYLQSDMVSDDPHFIVTSYNGIIGAHPHVVWLEDILQSEYKNEESNEYMLYEVFDAVIQKLSNRIGGTATRKGMEDLYSYLPERMVMLTTEKAITKLKGKWPSISDLIYDENNRVVDINIPDNSEFEIIERPGWTVKSLLIQRTLSLQDKRAFEMFEREMQNNPIMSEGLYFDTDQWVEVDQLTLKEIKGRCYVSIDPAYGKSTSADYFAVVVGVIVGHRLVIVKTELLKGLTIHQATELIQFYYNTYDPLVMLLEANFAQVWLAQAVSGIPPIKRVKHKTKKEERIDALSMPFSQQLIRICRDMGYIDEAYKQFVSYDRKPSTSTKHDDWLDALATLYQFTKPYLLKQQTYVKTWNNRA